MAAHVRFGYGRVVVLFALCALSPTRTLAMARDMKAFLV
jgi:hypothetical protein